LPARSTNAIRNFTEKDFSSLALLGRFRAVLAGVLDKGEVVTHRSFADSKRYLSLFLLGLFNPVARTLRGIVQASGLPEVRQKAGVPKVSLGSFSDAQDVVDPALLELVFASLAEQLPETGELAPALRLERWLARDSSLFAALPRMAWALYGGGRDGFLNNAVRLHVSFDLLKDAPASVQITPGKKCERATLRAEIEIKPGGAYVGDRYFGEDYGFFGHLSARGCPYLIRLLDRGAEPAVEEEIALSATDAQNGVLRQAWVRLGSARSRSERLRFIWVRGDNGEILHLATNRRPEELSAADAALLYKKRWQVEYFFRWVKCLLGCGHWLAESPRGVAIQLYLALIGAMLLQLDLGRRPSKRVWELLQWHLVGMLDDATLAQELSRQLTAEERQRAQKKTTRRQIGAAFVARQRRGEACPKSSPHIPVPLRAIPAPSVEIPSAREPVQIHFSCRTLLAASQEAVDFIVF
jgi:hypothetical protein